MQIKEVTDRELLEVKVDRAAKYKFLGAALILLRSMEKRQLRLKMRAMFTRWKYNQRVSKVSKTPTKTLQIAESAFNKLLELNHRHSQRRFATACYLLERSVGKIIKRDGLESISKFAMASQLRFYRQKKLNSSM